MTTQKVYLDYLPEYDTFGISDEKIKLFIEAGITPILELNPSDAQKLSEKQQNNENQPTVAFLMGREKGHYTVDKSYAKALCQTGAKLRFLTYEQNLAQMDGIAGLILPGGSFDSPNEFYTDPDKKNDNTPGTRSYAYISSIIKAEQEAMPILGICAGAQMLGGMHGMKMYRDLKEYTQTSIEHKTKTLDAHEVFVFADNPLSQILGEGKITVNSRHKEAMMPNDKISDMKIYASSQDGTPEAWGNEKKNILCIQWHPEDFAAIGDEKMQGIYNWLVDKAKEYHQNHQTKNIIKQKITSYTRG